MLGSPEPTDSHQNGVASTRSLQHQFSALFQVPVRLIAVLRRVFRLAPLRPERVFLSYAREDVDIVAPVARELRRRFKYVFDYLDPNAIAPGAEWRKCIYAELERCHVVIPCISEYFISSGPCINELEVMMQRYRNGAVRVFPIKLTEQRLQIPESIRHIQYIRYSGYKSPRPMIDHILRQLDNLG